MEGSRRSVGVGGDLHGWVCWTIKKDRLVRRRGSRRRKRRRWRSGRGEGQSETGDEAAAAEEVEAGLLL
jgi:hypothetical protein